MRRPDANPDPAAPWRVLHTAQVYPRTPDDGMAPFLHEATKALVNDDRIRSVDVLVPHDAALPEEEERDGVRIHRFRYARTDVDEDLAYRGDMHRQVLGSPLGALRFLRFLGHWRRALVKRLGTQRPDLVHLHWWVPTGLVAARVCRRGGVPYVVSCHGTDVALLRKHPRARMLARRVFANARVIHVVSDTLRRDLVDALGEPIAARMHVFPMPVAERLFEAADLPKDWNEEPADAEAGLRILFVGRLVPVKGVPVLLDAYDRLCDDWPKQGTKPRLDIIGDGPLRSELEGAARTHPHADGITFHGAVAPGELARRYAEADVLVVPSITTPAGEREGLGMVALEAMATGTPVIASRSGGLVDLIEHGVDGTLVDEGDPAALASALRRLAAEPTPFQKMAETAQERVRRAHGLGAFAERLLAMYAEAMR